ncbi:MAG: FkbM family methyltransferase [Candidatus Dojkabacteria bacterium]|nr:FkbM family methyltransferase [Candidatus Dojkabacteria bacterium]
MEPKTRNFKNYSITYFDDEEFKILSKEIFGNEVYKTVLDNPAPLIYDLGSHIGLSVLYFKKQYPNSKIISFEPNPNVYPLLLENIETNNIRNVQTYNLALSRKKGVRRLYIDKSQRGCFSTSSFTKNAWDGKQKSIGIDVQTDRLSNYINKSIDLLKMDIEGAELEVLKEIDSNNKIKMIKKITIEYHQTDRKRLKELLRILQRNNFNIKQGRNDNGLIYILGEYTA